MSSERGAPPPEGEFRDLTSFVIDPDSVKLLKRSYCEQHQAVLLGTVDPLGDDPITVGMLDPRRADLIAEIENVLGRPVVPVQLNAYEIERALRIGHGEIERSDGTGRLTLRAGSGISFETDASLIEILDEILGQAVARNASDIHVETYEDDVDVRYRIDGVLRNVQTPLSRKNVAAAVSRLKVVASLDVAEHRLAQDGRINAVYADSRGQRNIDFRVSVLPGPFGEDVVLRILDSAKPLIGLERLGFEPETRAGFERVVAAPEGLVLVVGPTGSGKTTTLYSAIQFIRSDEEKLLTVEDPIEYFFRRTNQKQVSPKMSFADFARAFMRQDPDVILIGEIRDEETADVALRAAQTGHLVLSTLHANDAVRAVARLKTLGLEPSYVAGCLLGSLAQRLVRRLCPKCRQEAAPPADVLQRLGAPDVQVASYAARGCEACEGQGYKGRTGVYELFAPDERMADLIAHDAPPHELRRAAIQAGMRTLLQDALAKADEGVTSLREILRVVPAPHLSGESGFAAGV